MSSSQSQAIGRLVGPLNDVIGFHGAGVVVEGG